MSLTKLRHREVEELSSPKTIQLIIKLVALLHQRMQTLGCSQGMDYSTWDRMKDA
jgi:hypothetical protein